MVKNSADTKWIVDNLICLANELNRELNIDISEPEPRIQLSVYNKGDFYKTHTDTLHGQHIQRKMTMVVQLMEPGIDYNGGELIVHTSPNKVLCPENILFNSKQGAVIAFPSILLHQVYPVSAGTRKTLVAWFMGPPWR